MISQESHTLLCDPGLVKTIGLISDTHIPIRARKVPRRVFEVFDKVDFILHAGDLVDLSVINSLEQLAPVLAVYGNMDGLQIRSKLPRMNSLKVFNWKIGIMHDPGTLSGMGRMHEIAEQKGFNVLIYGHTHSPSIKWEGNTLFINPGSPTNPLPPFIIKPTVALLKITRCKIVPEIAQI